MVIRWLGAFRKTHSLPNSLEWELTQDCVRALAAEKLDRGRSYIHHAKIGLLVKNSAILRRYRGDVWSTYRTNGKLVKNRHEKDAQSWHSECWIQPGHFIGIVIKGKVSKHAWQACSEASKKHNIPIFRLTRDRRFVAIN